MSTSDAPGQAQSGDYLRLDAFAVSSTRNWTLAPAPAPRGWMDASPNKFAYRCLPLVMANQAGWLVGCPLHLRLTWDGSADRNGLRIEFPKGEGENAGQVRSHFGMGIVTFSLPWLFRTSQGYGLWVRGPANMPRDAIAPLEGIVETDWNPATFTMNWKITRPHFTVEFTPGEAIALLVPMPMTHLERVAPRHRAITDDPALQADYDAFNRSRLAALQQIATQRTSAWSMDYMRGHLPDGTLVTEHRKAFKLREFQA